MCEAVLRDLFKKHRSAIVLYLIIVTANSLRGWKWHSFAVPWAEDIEIILRVYSGLDNLLLPVADICAVLQKLVAYPVVQLFGLPNSSLILCYISILIISYIAIYPLRDTFSWLIPSYRCRVLVSLAIGCGAGSTEIASTIIGTSYYFGLYVLLLGLERPSVSPKRLLVSVLLLSLSSNTAVFALPVLLTRCMLDQRRAGWMGASAIVVLSTLMSLWISTRTYGAGRPSDLGAFLIVIVHRWPECLLVAALLSLLMLSVARRSVEAAWMGVSLVGAVGVYTCAHVVARGALYFKEVPTDPVIILPAIHNPLSRHGYYCWVVVFVLLAMSISRFQAANLRRWGFGVLMSMVVGFSSVPLVVPISQFFGKHSDAFKGDWLRFCDLFEHANTGGSERRNIIHQFSVEVCPCVSGAFGGVSCSMDAHAITCAIRTTSEYSMAFSKRGPGIKPGI